MTKETLESWYKDRFPNVAPVQASQTVEELEETYDSCSICNGTGEISCDERDREGNWESGTGTQMCECRLFTEEELID